MSREITKEDIPKIKGLLHNVMDVEYKHIERMGGLTNHTYKVKTDDGRLFAVRIPGEGTEELINRRDERVSTELACKLAIDAKLLYFSEEGEKITEYIPHAVTMSSELLRNEMSMKLMSDVLNKLHHCNVNTNVMFDVFDMAAGYEQIIMDNGVSMFEDYEDVKNRVMQIKSQVDTSCDVKCVPCHNDPLCENWIMSDSTMFLIDWEYAGMNDPYWDLADVSIEAGYNEQQDLFFLTQYLGHKPDALERKHFAANKVYVDFLWTLWAKTRVPYDGQAMEDWAEERYMRLKKNMIVMG